MRTNSLIIILLLIASLPWNAKAQVELKEKKIPVDIAIELKNAHIWRGLDVTHNFLIDGDMRLSNKSKSFAFGIWGATTFSKDFREFDYYVGYYQKGFSVEVWDVYNFSEKNKYDPLTNPTGYNVDKAFDYSSHGTGHFIDLRLAYQFPKQFPLRLGWSTVLYGRDKVHLTNAETGREYFSKNRYTSYVEASYPILKGNLVDVNVGVAGAFALKSAKINGEKIKGNFYGESGGVVNVNLTVSKDIQLGKNYDLPISLMAVWNPEANKTFLQIAFQVLKF